MNSVTSIHTENVATGTGSAPKLAIDANDHPSDAFYPDLGEAEPIDELVCRLRRLRSCFPTEFYRACRASGIHLSISVLSSGEEHFYAGLPCDKQSETRRMRFDKLQNLLNSTARRRKGVRDLVNFLGHFADNRPFESVEMAADQYLTAGGRIYVLPNGRCEEVMPDRGRGELEDSWEGYPVRRTMQRYNATLRQRGARSEMTELVRRRGKFHKGSRSYVLETAGRNI